MSVSKHGFAKAGQAPLPTAETRQLLIRAAEAAKQASMQTFMAAGSQFAGQPNPVRFSDALHCSLLHRLLKQALPPLHYVVHLPGLLHAVAATISGCLSLCWLGGAVALCCVGHLQSLAPVFIACKHTQVCTAGSPIWDTPNAMVIKPAHVTCLREQACTTGECLGAGGGTEASAGPSCPAPA